MPKCRFTLSIVLLLAWFANPNQAQSADDSISRAELRARAQETDRGKALYSELVRNERALDGLGPSHPSVQVLNENIRGLTQQLLDWINRPVSSDSGTKTSKDGKPSAKEKPARESNRVSATQDELMKVIAALVNRIERLEARVRKLEAASR